MLTYLIRRLLYMIPILFGVMVITFILFFVVTTPEQMAMRTLGPKASLQTRNNWLVNHRFAYRDQFDKEGKVVPIPTFINRMPGKSPFDSLFFHTIVQFSKFNLGVSFATNEPILDKLKRGALPSLLITLPAFVIGLILAVSGALFFVLVRESLLDRTGIVACVATMSIPITVYVIFCQWVGSSGFGFFPAFGFNFEGISSFRFLVLPIFVIAFSGIGGDIRLFRTIFLEEARADFVRTAHAKGASNMRVIFVHILKNGMISIITLVVAAIPSLILGTLVVESFFGIPGLGDIMATAIHSLDFAVIMAYVYLGSVLYLIGLLLTDICYAAVDPRIRLQ